MKDRFLMPAVPTFPLGSPVVLLLGGPSAEREVSLVSGKECGRALRNLGYKVHECDPGSDPADLPGALMKALSETSAKAVFNALHGQYGEDGRVQALLDMLGVSYTHSSALCSAVCMDKSLTCQLLQAAGLPVPDGETVSAKQLRRGVTRPPPYVVKPVAEGSSLGVVIVKETDPAPDFSNWSYGDARVEEYIAGEELTVAVLDDQALAVTALHPQAGFYDYAAKYTDGKTDHICPAPLDPALYDRLLKLSESACLTLGCKGASRVDFRYDKDGYAGAGRLAILEVNTQPGMTPLSLVPEQARHIGLDFDQLVGWMLNNAYKRS